MITIEFAKAGVQVKASVETAKEATELLSSLGSSKASTAASPAKSASKSRYANPPSVRARVRATKPERWHQPWSMEEVAVLHANRELPAAELTKLPVLQGRTRKSLNHMRAYLIAPSTLSHAPAGFRRVAQEVLSRPA